MPQIVKPGMVASELSNKVRKELGCGQIPVIATGSHDTASAVAAVPAQEGNWAYLSSGTWSLMGVEVPQAFINDKTFRYEFTNEGGVENTIRLLKNIMGLWLMQESKRQWQREGIDLSYAELAEMAEKAKPFAAYIDPEILKQIPSYVPGQAPTVPGHEAAVGIEAAGLGVKNFKVGERYFVQTDYRWLRTANSNSAFGYNFEGALQEYVLMDERVITLPDGESMLLPASEGLSCRRRRLRWSSRGRALKMRMPQGSGRA